jgi:hypothetical protein
VAKYKNTINNNKENKATLFNDPKKKGNCKTNIISTSKIKNKIKIKKNRNEKGVREEFFLSNPHSKGDLISRLPIKLLKETNNTPNITTPPKITINKLNTVNQKKIKS